MYNHICKYKCYVYNICTCVSISKKIQPYVISCMCVASATYPMAEHECYAIKVMGMTSILLPISMSKYFICGSLAHLKTRILFRLARREKFTHVAIHDMLINT